MCTTTGQLSPTMSQSESGGSPACFWPEGAQGLNAGPLAPELVMSLVMGGAVLPFGLPPFSALPPLCPPAPLQTMTPSLAACPCPADYFLHQRFKVHHEEPKPNHSYIGLIAMAILSASDKKLLLSEIYDWILKNYTYFRNKGPGWRNSVRHNLSLNDCFVKVGRAANGKGHYWSIHPANLDDFQRGDFRRRKAQRKVRKHMGLSCADDDDSSRSASPAKSSASVKAADAPQRTVATADTAAAARADSSSCTASGASRVVKRPRPFDVESLLRPDRQAGMSEPEPSAQVQNAQLAQYFANLNAFYGPQGNYLAALANYATLTDS